MNPGDVYCVKEIIPTICRPEKRKGDSFFPKWYCFNCRRYVLPDKFHRPDFGPEYRIYKNKE